MNTNTGPDQYQPGVCNIGPSEVRVRRLFFRIILAVTLLMTIAAVFWSHSIPMFILMLFTSFSMIVLHFEIRYRFCILFGFFNLHNFRQLGNLEEVKSEHHSKLDRKRVWKIVLQSFAFALLYSSTIHFIAERSHGH
ncbi:MAG: hypothetical protein ACKOKF_12670 [Bacteroidota bacterium]